MNEPVVRVEAAGPVTWLRLDRPEAMNALDDAVLVQLDAAVSAVERDPAVRVVVLTGSGRAFCAGANLTGMTSADGSVDPDELLAFVRRAGATVNRIAGLSKPVLAAVNGLALAGGLELVLACDVVIAARSARLGDAHANFGLLPGAGGAVRLARVVGPTVAKYLAFTGEFVAAADLVAFGLVHEVVADDELEQRVTAVAEKIAGKSPSGLAQMKRLIDDGLEQSLPAALRAEHQALAAHVHSADLREGLAAFREKRPPHYSGR